jgi:pimeloyl-ACP methyl ester carboxylesterase
VRWNDTPGRPANDPPGRPAYAAPAADKPWTERFVQANGIRFHLIEQGRGPLVVLLHGFPHVTVGWRKTMAGLAKAGFRAVALTQRGYGQTGQVGDTSQYTIFHLAGDVVAVVDALLAEGEGNTHGERVALLGQDWGAIVAWHCALFRPDRFRAIAALAAPYMPRSDLPPTQRIGGFVGDRHFYTLHFQTPGVAEREFTAMDLREAFRRLLYGASGDAPAQHRVRPTGPHGMPLFEGTVDPVELPPWLDQELIDAYAEEFGRTGFTGALNWYRAMDLNWALTAPFAGARIQVPALYLYGEQDPMMPYFRRYIIHLKRNVANLCGSIPMPGAGHLLHLERTDEVLAAVVPFFHAIA